MKRVLSAILILVLTLGTVLSGCAGSSGAPVAAYYEEAVLRRMKVGIGVADRMSGMADGVVLAEEKTFDPDYVSATAAGLFAEDAEEGLLYAKAITERVYPASMTKCMTALLTLEYASDLNEELTVTSDAYRNLSDDSSTANLKVGGTYSVKSILYALLLPSANEAANILAVYVSGSIEAFVQKMNARALELGMMNTRFKNPHGLHDAGHYTTVYDLYLLFRELIRIPAFLEIAGTKSAEIRCTINGMVETSVVTTTNSYIRQYAAPPRGINPVAGKTGYTASAGRCLIMLFMDARGKRYITVVAHANTYDGVYEETSKLLELIR